MSARIRTEGLSLDEVRLLRAFRAMDDRARRDQLAVSIRFSKEFPGSDPGEPVTATDEVLLLADFRTMDHDRKSELLALSSYYASKYPGTDGVSVARGPTLRLIRGGLA